MKLKKEKNFKSFTSWRHVSCLVVVITAGYKTFWKQNTVDKRYVVTY